MHIYYPVKIHKQLFILKRQLTCCIVIANLGRFWMNARIKWKILFKYPGVSLKRTQKQTHKHRRKESIWTAWPSLIWEHTLCLSFLSVQVFRLNNDSLTWRKHSEQPSVFETRSIRISTCGRSGQNDHSRVRENKTKHEYSLEATYRFSSAVGLRRKNGDRQRDLLTIL